MISIPALVFATSGILLAAVMAYGFIRTRKLAVNPRHYSVRVMILESITTTSTYAKSHGYWATIHAAEHISHGIHAGTQAFQKLIRVLIRSSFFPHKEVHNHESLLKALLEEKKTIEQKIEKLNIENK